MKPATPKQIHHQRGVGPSMIPQILSEIQAKLRLFSTSTARGNAAGFTSSRMAGAATVASAASDIRQSSGQWCRRKRQRVERIIVGRDRRIPPCLAARRRSATPPYKADQTVRTAAYEHRLNWESAYVRSQQ